MRQFISQCFVTYFFVLPAVNFVEEASVVTSFAHLMNLLLNYDPTSTLTTTPCTAGPKIAACITQGCGKDYLNHGRNFVTEMYRPAGIALTFLY